MPEITIEIDDKGNIDKLPDAVQAFFDKRFKQAFREGAEKAEKELSAKGLSAPEIERLKSLEDENSRFREDEAKRKGEHAEAMKIAEERHAKALEAERQQLTERDTQIARRDSRLRDMLGAEIRAAAVAAGARDESLPELAKLLGAALDLDADLNPYVKAEDGSAKTDAEGKPVSIEGLVTQYLADHPHHLRRGGGKPGGAGGGATYRGGGLPTDADAATEVLRQQPTVSNLARAIRATTTRRAS